MAFSIVADLDEKVMEKKVKKLISKYFPTLEEPQKKEIPEFIYEPKIFDKTLNKRNHQVNCIIGGLAPSLYKTKERVATVLLVNILGGPANNSLLNATLREKYGWVYGVECSYNQYSDCGLVTISLGCDKDNLDKCLHHTKKIIAKLQECELSDKKLREAKKQLLGQLAISSDNGETQCLSLGKSLLAFGIVNSDSATKKIIEEITSKDLQEMAQTIFDPSKTSKLIYI
jgi:predicted Zn-dependent peptidase